MSIKLEKIQCTINEMRALDDYVRTETIISSLVKKCVAYVDQYKIIKCGDNRVAVSIVVNEEALAEAKESNKFIAITFVGAEVEEKMLVATQSDSYMGYVYRIHADEYGNRFAYVYII